VKIQLAVFDMVGTTVRAGSEVPSAFREAFLSVGIAISDEAITGIRGRSKKDAISELLTAVGVPTSRHPEMSRVVFERFQAHLRRAYQTQASANPESVPVFRFLQGAGIRVVLSTGLDRETACLLLRSLGWDSLGLDGLVSGDDVGRGRPAPDLIHAAMRLAGVTDPGAVLVAGDTASDLEAAANAGVGWSVGALTGAHPRVRLEAQPHSAILENVGELPRWLAEVGALAGP
jgi:phosphonatase-like hydrolase